MLFWGYQSTHSIWWRLCRAQLLPLRRKPYFFHPKAIRCFVHWCSDDATTYHFLLLFSPITFMLADTLTKNQNAMASLCFQSLKEFTLISFPILSNSNKTALSTIKWIYMAVPLDVVALNCISLPIFWNFKAAKTRRVTCDCPEQHTTASYISSTLGILQFISSCNLLQPRSWWAHCSDMFHHVISLFSWLPWAHAKQ